MAKVAVLLQVSDAFDQPSRLRIECGSCCAQLFHCVDDDIVTFSKKEGKKENKRKKRKQKKEKKTKERK
jgi:uncharacterized metal-binding protein